MSTTTTPALELRAVHKRFGDVHAVAGVDLTVKTGEVVAFLGPNGAGKTTTIDMMLGLSTPTSGEVHVCGMQPREAVNHGLISAVMQTGGLLPDLTVADTVELTASLFGREKSAAHVMGRAGVSDFASRKVAKCSGGQKQRLRFAMALVSDPAVIVLDEPTAGMDVESRRQFWAAIHADARRGRTVVFATHYLEEADAYADRIVLVRQGKIVADGTASQIRARVSGKRLEAQLSPVGRSINSRDLAAKLGAIPGVRDVSLTTDRLSVTADDTDPIAHLVLHQGLGKDLVITTRGLEDAFIALTGTDDRTSPTTQRVLNDSPDASLQRHLSTQDSLSEGVSA